MLFVSNTIPRIVLKISKNQNKSDKSMQWARRKLIPITQQEQQQQAEEEVEIRSETTSVLWLSAMRG